MPKRKATISRKTKETEIELTLNLDGTGKYDIETGVGFFNHMLELFSKHSLIDLRIKAHGDTQVDYHHLVEDVGICLGKAFSESLGDCAGIKRYASLSLPMDETLVSVAVDIGGRPHLEYRVNQVKAKIGEFDSELVEEFFRGFVTNAKLNLHINLNYGDNLHHISEAIFKGTARTLRAAVTLDPKATGIPSTKGML
jgi:imidazoleglycerol-phosphate dehydratase